MKKFFAANINGRGRLFRGGAGILLVGVGLMLASINGWAAGVLILAGAFCLFEAGRGWCLLRACGIKTKL